MLNIKIRTTPIDLEKRITEAPRGARGKMAEEAAWYMVENREKGLKKYPPPPPKSKHKRTYMLKEGWGFKNYGAKIQIQNTARDKRGRYYPPYVMGDADQAWMHKGRWRTVSMVLEDTWQGMIKAAERALSKYLKERGL
jgi:hypothetical protein